METGELTRKEVSVIELYLHYWKIHIKPLEDKSRVVQFEYLLNEVALELYGPRVAFELAVGFLVEDREPSNVVTDG